MRVEVEYEIPTRMVNVYIAQDGMDGQLRVWTPTAERDWVDVPAGGIAPVSLRFPHDVWEAIAGAAADVPIPSKALAEHLADTREVRDRLLAMAERSTLRPLPTDG